MRCLKLGVDLSWDPQYQEAIRHEIDVFLVVDPQTPLTKNLKVLFEMISK